MKDFRMLDLQKRIIDLFNDFEEEASDNSKFLMSLEKLVIIEKILGAKSYDDFKRTRKMMNYIIRFESQKKSLHKKIRQMGKLMKFTTIL